MGPIAIADPVDLMPTGIDTTTIVERYQTMVYAIALTHSPTRNDADDVFQEVFLTYHRKNPPCEHEDHRKAWLITTTLNIARRVAGSSWSTKVVPVDASDLGDSSYRFDNHEYDELFTALRSIPHEYRTVIHLFYFEDQSVDEIAGVLDAKPGAIKMRLSRGRTMLREVLSKEKDHG